MFPCGSTFLNVKDTQTLKELVYTFVLMSTRGSVSLRNKLLVLLVEHTQTHKHIITVDGEHASLLYVCTLVKQRILTEQS